MTPPPAPDAPADSTSLDVQERDDPPVTLAAAVATIERATAFTEPLRRRTEGVTIALWGFVTACVVLSNALVDDVYGFWHAGGWRTLVSAFLWVPWAAIGVAGTLAVWRIAEARTGQQGPGRRRSPTAVITWFAVCVAVLGAITVFPTSGAGASVAALGLLWLAVGALDLYKATPAGRRTLIAVGSVILVAGGVFEWATRGWPVTDAWASFELVAVPTAGLVPILGGLYQTLRG